MPDAADITRASAFGQRAAAPLMTVLRTSRARWQGAGSRGASDKRARRRCFADTSASTTATWAVKQRRCSFRRVAVRVAAICATSFSPCSTARTAIDDYGFARARGAYTSPVSPGRFLRAPLAHADFIIERHAAAYGRDICRCLEAQAAELSPCSRARRQATAARARSR